MILKNSGSQDEIMGKCMLVTEKQLAMLSAEAKQSEDRSAMNREKKGLQEATKKWPMPVNYKFFEYGDVNAY